MCSIVGAILHDVISKHRTIQVNRVLNHLMEWGHTRGRDGRGYVLINGRDDPQMYADTRRAIRWDDQDIVDHLNRGTFIAQCRAEPTTEFVKDKQEWDQQPYSLGGWHIVHNGTIANDKELRTHALKTTIDSAAIVERLHKELPHASLHSNVDAMYQVFKRVVKWLKGSYAILATHQDLPGVVFTACNYRPIWYTISDYGVYFASAREMFLPHQNPQMIKPYTTNMFALGVDGDVLRATHHLPRETTNKALVVCSGGLDSVVAAVMKHEEGTYIELIHFMYGSRAESKEVAAIKNVAIRLGVKLTLFPLPVYKPGDSPLLNANAAVAGGEAGAEFAHEWVPARNLLLLSVATAFAEANGFDEIVLGNNLEEAGAYPDNEPEFIARFNDILPFAVGDGKKVRVTMPVGNMMKHEIVAQGLALGAPLDLTWSCYRAGELHCGTCGPCYMRKTAFEINEVTEVIEYAVRF